MKQTWRQHLHFQTETMQVRSQATTLAAAPLCPKRADTSCWEQVHAKMLRFCLGAAVCHRQWQLGQLQSITTELLMEILLHILYLMGAITVDVVRNHAVGSMSPFIGCLFSRAGSQHAGGRRNAQPLLVLSAGQGSPAVMSHTLKEILLPSPPWPKIAVAIEKTAQRTSTGLNDPFCCFVFCLIGPSAWLTAWPEAGGRVGQCLLMEMLAQDGFKSAGKGSQSDQATVKASPSCHGGGANQEFSV